MSVRIKEHPEEKIPKIYFRVKPIVTGITTVSISYRIQEKVLWWWMDLSYPIEDKQRLQKYCDELNEFYNKQK